MNDRADGKGTVYRSLSEVPPNFGPVVAAIGNFDGVHRGHREILTSVVADARTRGIRSLAITFDPHPEQFLRPDSAPGLLTLMPERLRLLRATGVDAVLVLPFEASLANMRAREFVQSVLLGLLKMRAVHEGGNFRFGRRAEAGIPELQEFGAEFGFDVHLHRSVRVHGLEISSSATRKLVAAGEMQRTRWMLGRPFAFPCAQARGRGVGTRLLVPTVNLAPYAGLLPAFGVYATHLTIGERCFQAVTNAGNRPTFEGVGFGVETHILNFDPIEITDETPLRLEFLLRLRPEIAWPSPEALKAQILKDVARAKRYFHLVDLLCV
ncbi:MAG TPA: bifunctional riboflavin kinase/FMN adenylyltransferase [Terracidiphilus sp.]|jgi:riboflavin kinase/FMN adenylyltransferase|nr:bifunctional riboflavin kinase/FMN adenylyltransferase [Terracidiphilus sp.]